MIAWCCSQACKANEGHLTYSQSLWQAGKWRKVVKINVLSEQ